VDVTAPGYKFAINMHKAPQRHPGVEESGVGKLLVQAGAAGGDARFETATQASLRTGLHGKADTAHRPVTSAGYRTADHGMLREQVYSAIRQLDAGALPAGRFRERMAALGMPIPPVAERLLHNYDTNGKADFSRFVRAFEDAFAERTVAAVGGEAAMVEGSGDAPLTASGAAADVSPSAPFAHDSTSAGTYRSARAAAQAERSHGDILGWQGEAAQNAEVREGTGASRRRHVTDRRLYDKESPALDIMSVQDQARFGATGRSDAIMGTAPDLRPSRRAVADARYRTAGNITAWAGGDFGPEGGVGSGGGAAAASSGGYGAPQAQGQPQARPGTAAPRYDGRAPWDR
jgi:hypothetical protein